MKRILKKRIKLILFITTLFAIVNIALSFSYLRGEARYNESVSTISLTGGRVRVKYSSSTGSLTISNINPGYEGSKQFTITSDFGEDHGYYVDGIWYTVVLKVEKNEFDTNSIQYSLSLDSTSDNDGITLASIQNKGIPTGTNTSGIILGSGKINTHNKSHIYNLKISYPDNGTDQSHEIGCKFNAYIDFINTNMVGLTFNLDGGSFTNLNLNENSSIKVPANSTINLPTPTKNGYAFSGWEIVGENVSVNNTLISTGSNNITLKALWSKGVFDYTGGVQQFIAVVPGYYKLEAWGASGNNNYNSYTLQNSSYAGYTSGNIYLSKDELLYLYVGGQGNTFNCCSKQGSRAGSGGATDVRLVSGEWNNTNSLTSRIMVAGGAGGPYTDSSAPRGGSAGGLTSYSVSHDSHPVAASTQVSGGTAGYNGTAGGFGYGGTNSDSGYNSGAGGYYGGGSGPAGGGGSSYISGHSGCVAIESGSSTSARTGTGGASCTTGTSDNLCSVHYSGKVFTDTVMIDGAGYVWTNTKGSLQRMPNPNGGYYASGVGHSGNGYARITYLHS